ncbi:uncharacterized protein Z518_09637 [Rhinocladiella mackenziei CBS 650.93]|uniref:Rhinocladiella mackenziei CBS 650.93 unplaced genomic scaffold supercont1.8, whole genome shotgun sequence n=1 Tax=Rhinocladiella mackenziei CBS 650.93 TaxID=1442369 RepID=A0A0D2FEY7_9EURO|nr:uncharacterized protein Z518_09637 [Rhinocladiella mackenziei CBS 650.93]KIX00572.1 hypothetical protein Z518_09637 [Rhinocladiella mackenziei CBS 650.93]
MASRIALEFPSPILESRSKTRMARKSSCIEAEAPLAGPADWKAFPSFIYPIYLGPGTPVVWNTLHTNLECLPVINTSRQSDFQWLITHSSGMFSKTERELRDNSMLADQKKDVRVRFNDSLFSLLMHFSGLQAEEARLFGLNNPIGPSLNQTPFILRSTFGYEIVQCKGGRC